MTDAWTVTPGDAVPSPLPPGTIDSSVYGRSAVIYSNDWTQGWYGNTGNAYGHVISVRNMPSGAPRPYQRIPLYLMVEQFDPSDGDDGTGNIVTRDLTAFSFRATLRTPTYGRVWAGEIMVADAPDGRGYAVGIEWSGHFGNSPVQMDPDALDAKVVGGQLIAASGVSTAGFNFLAMGGTWAYPVRFAPNAIAPGGAAVRIDRQVSGADALRIATDTWSTFVADDGTRYTAFGFLSDDGSVHVGDPKADTKLGDGRGGYISVRDIKDALTALGYLV